MQNSAARTAVAAPTPGTSSPRIILTADTLARLRARARQERMWSRVRARADELLAGEPPPYRTTLPNGNPDVLQETQRATGDALPFLALAWLIEGERRYLEGAERWARASCAYPTWGLKTWIDGRDLAAAHQLFGLSLLYDWCGGDLDAGLRDIIRATLLRKGERSFTGADGAIWWRDQYLQNHQWIGCCGLMAAGLALRDEHPACAAWVDKAVEIMTRALAALGPDGVSHEGILYWGYGVDWLLKYNAMAAPLAGAAPLRGAWWRNTAAYVQYVTLPAAGWPEGKVFANFADCHGHRIEHGPDYQLRALAGINRDGHAQWLANELDEHGVTGAGSCWLNLIWHDASVKPEPPDALPTLRHFDDMGIVSARTDWSREAALLLFKCGPHIGHHAMKLFAKDPGGGHAHPDANHFLLYSGAECLLRDDGYWRKQSRWHNTLLVDGAGQIGEGGMWFDGQQAIAAQARPLVTQVSASGNVDRMSGDATSAYPAKLGLRRYVRHLLFVKPATLLVIDDIETADEALLELRFYPSRAPRRAEDGAWLTACGDVALRIECLTRENVRQERATEMLSGVNVAEPCPLEGVRLHTRARQWRNAVALTWSRDGHPPARVSLTRDDALWRLDDGRGAVSFDWRTR